MEEQANLCWIHNTAKRCTQETPQWTYEMVHDESILLGPLKFPGLKATIDIAFVDSEIVLHHFSEGESGLVEKGFLGSYKKEHDLLVTFYFGRRFGPGPFCGGGKGEGDAVHVLVGGHGADHLNLGRGLMDGEAKALFYVFESRAVGFDKGVAVDAGGSDELPGLDQVSESV